MADRDDLVEIATAEELGSERVASGLSNPLFVTAPPGDFDRLFILEKNTGQVKILNLLTGTVNAIPFLDLDVSTVNEQGLLGLAFDPDYRDNGIFYVNFTDRGGNSTIQRFQVSSDPDVADASSGEIISRIAQPAVNHNGGWIGFGPDGFLYYATGDGGGTNDPQDNGQDLTTLLGKMLRIDVRSGEDDFIADADRNYAIPSDNPFIGDTQDGKPVREEIWSYGLRNPWRPSFDRETGDLYIADVGQGAREEINFQPAESTGGENYGWRLREGKIQTPDVGGAPPADNVDPIYDYARGSDGFLGKSVTGGYVYRGPVAELQGKYVFGDFISNRIWSFEVEGGGFVNLTDWTTDLQPGAGDIRRISSFGEDAAGNLYIVDFSDGEIFRVIGPTGTSIPTPGDDLLIGTPAADTIEGLGGNDSIEGLGGDDLLRGGFGFDTLDGGDGTDTADLSHTNSAATIDLAAGEAVFGGGVEPLESIENVIGTDGDNFIIGTGGANRLEGGGGDDTLQGGFGFDTLDGGEGTDTADLSHTGSAATIDLAAGQVVFAGGIETLVSIENAIGTNGDNFINGTGGANRLEGRDGDDTLKGGSGYDTVDGGDGTDTADLSHTSADADIDLAAGQAVFAGGVETLISIENAIGTNGANFMTGTGGANRLEGRDGDDTLKGGSGYDTVDGGDGTDTADLSHTSADADIDLAAGQVVFGGGVETLISIENAIGTNGANFITGTGGANRLEGGGGNDTLKGGFGYDTLDGGAGTDTADLSHTSADADIDLSTGQAVFAGGVETLIDIENAIGTDGDNVMTGTAGANVLEGAGGNDTLQGNGGQDRFFFQGTVFDQDVIIDFALASDKIVLDGVGGANDAEDLNYIVGNFGGGGGQDIRIAFNGLGVGLADERIDVLDVGPNVDALKADILFV